MPATVNADLFRVVANFIASEETRYYLRGVLIQRHQLKGVYLVATNGHRMMVAWDENGATDLDDVIVSLDKHALAMCKAARGEASDRVLTVNGDGEAFISSDDRQLSSYRNCIVDGTFPDWRRVMPREDAECAPESFAHKYLADFCNAAVALDKNATKTNPASIRVYGGGGNPALIRFRNVDNAFGVLMPVRDDNHSPRLPWFLTAAPAAQMAAE